MKEKILLKIIKMFGYYIFKENKNSLCIVSGHAINRSEQRITQQTLLRIVSENALEFGEHSVHFDYKINQKKHKQRKLDGIFAKKYKGYIFVFDKNKKLITTYQNNSLADLLITRK